MKTVLIITNKLDTHVDYIVERLHEQGIRFFRFNTDEYPKRINVDVDLDKNRLNLFFKKHRVFLENKEIRSVWFRRPLDFGINTCIKGEMRKFAHDECSAVFECIFGLLEKHLWLSNPYAIRRAQHKLWQLNFAKNIGFVIPKTLCTSDPDAFLAFWRRCRGEVIYKPIGKNLTLDEKGNTQFAYANKLDLDFLKTRGNIKFAPCLFQEYIHKNTEIRVTVVGDKVFACEIHSQKSEKTKIDWRRYDFENTPHIPIQLPLEIHSLCVLLVKKLGLKFGAIDLIKTPDNKFIFLEINPNGQWLWIEKLTKLKISDAILDLLVN